jgi:tetratricopeptide (TPR) repeat protein
LNRPFTTYNGTGPYVFVCYAHADSERVYSDLKQIHDKKINVWYDEGIPAGTSWRSEIAAAIKGATKFLFYISEASLASNHCLREVDYALDNDIEIIPVYLDNTQLPGELELVLNRVQALFRENDTHYIQHVIQSLQQSTPFGRLPLQRKVRRLRTFLPWLAIGLCVLLLFFWSQRDGSFTSEKTTKSSATVPAAYDAYLQGLNLLERWDKEGNLDQAISFFREASKLDPSFALAFARAAEALRIRYALTGDETWLKEAVDSVNEAVRLNDGLAPVQIALGRIQATLGNFDLAFAALERALEIDANDAEANMAIGKLFARLGRSQDAEKSFKKAVALDPENPSNINSYANFLYDQGRFQEATSQWQRVISLAPDHYAALINLGSVFEETGRIPEAITMYERSIKIKPTYMGYSNLGTAYSRGKRYADAVQAYKQALSINDSDSLAWGNLAFIYSWLNGMDAKATETFEHAIALAEEARQQKPREAFVHSDLALYYAKTKQADLALQRLETALALAPESAEILANAAEAYELIGQRDQAVKFARKALALGFSRYLLQHNPELSELLSDPAMQDEPQFN